ncbi:hypothetical protein ABO04_11670 [Nitrosomonas sp. HPC101]|uniref:hypothetical protein n=1 Tax=Nitrosomonas sp. HPC101 TaxID=1658667 RepID=UPI00136F3A81|nr:hypothetical protein [Nitrosomonas sp. HPC101]MXS86527.1 hypothetical protein [Nitrosomonas sp. HPC101]
MAATEPGTLAANMIFFHKIKKNHSNWTKHPVTGITALKITPQTSWPEILNHVALFIDYNQKQYKIYNRQGY